MIPSRNILSNALYRRGDTLNILYFPLDGHFDQILGDVPHNFFVPILASKIPWNLELHPKPKNFTILSEGEILPGKQDFNLCICNDRIAQNKTANSLSHTFQVPYGVIDHAHPEGYIVEQDIKAAQASKLDILNIYTLPTIADQWQMEGTTISYGIDLVKYEATEKVNKTIVYGNFNRTDLQLLHTLQANVPGIRIYSNQDISTENLHKEMAEAKVFLNLFNSTSIQYPLLEAMAFKCAIVSNDIPAKSYVLDETNHKYSNDLNRLIEIIQEVYVDDNLYTKLVTGGYKTLVDKFDYETAVDKWTEVFEHATETMIYKRIV